MASTSQLIAVFATAARNRALRRVGLAFAAFNGAETGVWVALLVYAFQVGGASSAALIACLQLLPSVLLAPWLGALADRYRPGRVLLGAYVAFAGAMAVIAAVIAAGAPAAIVYVLSPLVNLPVCCVRPAQATLLPGIVVSAEELSASNAGQGWLESVSMLMAPLLVAVLLSVGGPGLGVAGMAVLAALAALLIATTSRSIRSTSARTPGRRISFLTS